MTESDFTAKLLHALRANHILTGHNAVIFKHCDRFSSGIPDFSISIGQRTLWFEVKKRGKEPTRLQAHYLKMLGESASAVITCSDDGREATITPLANLVGWMSFDQLVEEIITRCVA